MVLRGATTTYVPIVFAGAGVPAQLIYRRVLYSGCRPDPCGGSRNQTTVGCYRYGARGGGVSTILGRRVTTPGILKEWAHCPDHLMQRSKGTYGRPFNATAQPKVVFAPGLILRQRTERDLCSARSSKNRTRVCQTPSRQRATRDVLPLAAKDEQLEIVRRLGTHQCVLVQGPPGTGKVTH